MRSFFLRAVDGTDKSVDERRLITVGAFFIFMIVVFAVVGLACWVAIDTGASNTNAIAAIEKLLYLLGILVILMLIASQIITWQNINDTASIIKGVPGAVSSSISTISENVTTIKKEFGGDQAQ